MKLQISITEERSLSPTWQIEVRESRKSELVGEINKLLNNFRQSSQIV